MNEDASVEVKAWMIRDLFFLLDQNEVRVLLWVMWRYARAEQKYIRVTMEQMAHGIKVGSTWVDRGCGVTGKVASEAFKELVLYGVLREKVRKVVEDNTTLRTVWLGTRNTIDLDGLKERAVERETKRAATASRIKRNGIVRPSPNVLDAIDSIIIEKELSDSEKFARRWDDSSDAEEEIMKPSNGNKEDEYLPGLKRPPMRGMQTAAIERVRAAEKLGVDAATYTEITNRLLEAANLSIIASIGDTIDDAVSNKTLSDAQSLALRMIASGFKRPEDVGRLLDTWGRSWERGNLVKSGRKGKELTPTLGNLSAMIPKTDHEGENKVPDRIEVDPNGPVDLDVDIVMRSPKKAKGPR